MHLYTNTMNRAEEVQRLDVNLLMTNSASLGEDLLAVVEVEVPLEVADHLVAVGTLLLQWLTQVNPLHV